MRGASVPPDAEVADVATGARFLINPCGTGVCNQTDEVFAAFYPKGTLGFGPGKGLGEVGDSFAVGLGEEGRAVDAGVAKRLRLVGVIDAFYVDWGRFAGEFQVTAHD